MISREERLLRAQERAMKLVKQTVFDERNRPPEVELEYALFEPYQRGSPPPRIIFADTSIVGVRERATELIMSRTAFSAATRWLVGGKHVLKKTYLEQRSAAVSTPGATPCIVRDSRSNTSMNTTTAAPGLTLPMTPERRREIIDLVLGDEIIKRELEHKGVLIWDGARVQPAGMFLYSPPDPDPFGPTPRHVMETNLADSVEWRATYIGTSPVFGGKTALVRVVEGDTRIWAQFDERIELSGYDYSSGWHPFSSDAFRLDSRISQ